MSTPRPNRQLDTLSDRLRRAAAQTTAALEHLAVQRAHTPLLSASVTDSGPSSHGDHPDPTLRLVLQLDAIDYHRTAIHDAIHTLGVATDNLDEALRNAQAFRGIHDTTPNAPSEQHPLCSGGRPDLPWGDPQCGELVEYYHRADGSYAYRSDYLCAKHRKRKERYERGAA